MIGLTARQDWPKYRSAKVKVLEEVRERVTGIVIELEKESERELLKHNSSKFYPLPLLPTWMFRFTDWLPTRYARAFILAAGWANSPCSVLTQKYFYKHTVTFSLEIVTDDPMITEGSGQGRWSHHPAPSGGGPVAQPPPPCWEPLSRWGWGAPDHLRFC